MGISSRRMHSQDFRLCIMLRRLIESLAKRGHTVHQYTSFYLAISVSIASDLESNSTISRNEQNLDLGTLSKVT
jgi:hypothetical protein